MKREAQKPPFFVTSGNPLPPPVGICDLLKVTINNIWVKSKTSHYEEAIAFLFVLIFVF